MKIRKPLVLAALLVGASLLPGCRSVGSSAADGALIGGLLGAGGGYAIGHHRGNRTNHALMGAGIGALAGYLVGDQIDHRDREGIGGPETIRSSAPPTRYVTRRVVVRDECDPYPPGW